MKKSTLEHFKLDNTGWHYSDKQEKVVSDLVETVKQKAMIALIGTAGTGKTELVRGMKKRFAMSQGTQPVFVHVRDKKDDNVRIGSILNAIIYDLDPSEKPRRDPEARGRQAVRILGSIAVAQNRKVCVVIEDAHRLHANTISALKLLREDDFNGVAPLFSVIMLGWPKLEQKLDARKDILWRCDKTVLNEANGWMLFEDRVQYLADVFGHAIEAKTRGRIALYNQVPAQMDHYVKDKMEEGLRTGINIIDERLVKMSILERKEALNVSLQEIANVGGMGKSTVHDAISGNATQAKKDAVASALDKLELKMMNKTERRAS